MKAAAILVCAFTAVLGNNIDINIDLNQPICPLNSIVQKLLPHTYCDMFYLCSNGELIELHCSANLLFNENLLECDWAYNVDCSGRNISESGPPQNESIDDESDEGDDSNSDPSEAPEICAQPENDGVLVAHEYCNRFFKCSNQEPVPLRCPKNLLYNAYKKRCDWPINVNCGNRTIPEIDDNDDSDGDNSGEQEPAEPDDNNPVDAVAVCAEENSNGVLVSHEYCNWFYTCFDGQPSAQKCPPQLVYNPRKEQCDWPVNVNCGNKTISEPDTNDENDDNDDDDKEIDGPINEDPTLAAEICARNGSDGDLVANEFCNRFYKCFNGQPTVHKCPINLLYNPRTEQCDWPANVDCGNRTISEVDDDDDNDGENGSHEDDDKEIEGPINDDPALAAEICARNGSDGDLVANELCNRFYKCFNGQPTVHKCPINLLYNPRKEQCDWPANVDCGNRTISDVDDDDDNDGENGTNEDDDKEIEGPINDDPALAAEICARNGSDGVLIAHELCNRFYNCFNGRPTVHKCYTNLLYNPRKERCDWPANVNCGNRTISDIDDDDQDNDDNDGGNSNENNDDNDNGAVNDDPAEAAAICAQDESDGILIAHENCEQFYICNLFVPVPLKCVNGLLYNPHRERCDWPDNVNCGDRIVPVGNDTVSDGDEETKESCNCDPSEAPEICAREGSNEILIAHENCNQYYKCYSGKPKSLRCSSDLLYNPYKGWCDWPENVDCGDRVKPENDDSSDITNPLDAIEICARVESDGVLIAHEKCNQFFKCSHGAPVELECLSGLFYNPSLKICDWPINVDCGDRHL